MSRTTYGYLAFKIPDNGLNDDELVADHRRIVKEMVEVLKKNHGSLTTLAEVYEMSQTPAEDRLGDESIRKSLGDKDD